MSDLISREVLKKAVFAEFGNSNLTGTFNELIDNAPAVDTYTIEDIKEVQEKSLILGAKLAQRPQGEWIKDNSGNRFCSECGSSALYHEIGLKFESRFCPNCGAYMKGSVDNAPTVAINKDFYKTDKSNPINRSDLFQ